MNRFALMLGTVAVCGAVLAGPAKAETIILTEQDRAFLTDWIIEKNHGCPPGSTVIKEEHLLRSPSYRCVVPRGSSVVYLQPGMTIPETVTYTVLPDPVIQRLPPPPAGQIYVTADNNVYLIQPETRTVVEAVTVVGPAP